MIVGGGGGRLDHILAIAGLFKRQELLTTGLRKTNILRR